MTNKTSDYVLQVYKMFIYRFSTTFHDPGNPVEQTRESRVVCKKSNGHVFIKSLSTEVLYITNLHNSAKTYIKVISSHSRPLASAIWANEGFLTLNLTQISRSNHLR